MSDSTNLVLPTPITANMPPLRIAIYGEGGVGKTQFALSFPKPLVVDTDGGLEGGAIIAADGTVVDGEQWSPEKWRDLNTLYFWLKTAIEEKGYQTIVIDSLDTLCRFLRHEATAQATKGRSANSADQDLVGAEQQDYGKVESAVDLFLTKLKNLSRAKGVHIVITSAVRLPDPDKGRFKRTFDCQPAVEGHVTYWANVYGEFVCVETKPATKDAPAEEGRILWTRVSDRERKNKTRFAALRPGVTNPTFAKIKGLIEASLPTQETK